MIEILSNGASFGTNPITFVRKIVICIQYVAELALEMTRQNEGLNCLVSKTEKYERRQFAYSQLIQ